MNEHLELSRLPEDPEYWDGLEARILESLRTPLPALGDDAEWWAPLAARAYALGAAALAAGIAAALLLPAPSQSEDVETLFRPPAADPTLISPFAADTPPSIGQLMIPVTRSNP